MRRERKQRSYRRVLGSHIKFPILDILIPKIESLNPTISRNIINKCYEYKHFIRHSNEIKPRLTKTNYLLKNDAHKLMKIVLNDFFIEINDYGEKYEIPQDIIDDVFTYMSLIVKEKMNENQILINEAKIKNLKNKQTFRNDVKITSLENENHKLKNKQLEL